MTILRTHHHDGAVGTSATAAGEGYDASFGTAPVYAADGVSGECLEYSTTGYGDFADLVGARNARLYLRFPDTAGAIHLCHVDDSSNAHIGELRTSSSGALSLADAAAIQSTSTFTCPAGEWVRLEYLIGDGTQTLRIFSPHEATTATETITAPVTSTAAVARWRTGQVTNSGVGFQTDEIDLSDDPDDFAPATPAGPTVRGVISGGSEAPAALRGVISGGVEVAASVREVTSQAAPPSGRAFLVGMTNNDAPSTIVPTFGHDPEASRSFDSGGLPASYSYPGTWPYTAQDWHSFKTVDAQTGSWAASAPAGTHITFHHEPEGPEDKGDYASGADFIAEWTTAYNAIKAGNPDIPVVMIAGSYGYREGGNGYDGSYIPSPDHCDIYCFDTYQGNAGPSTLITPLEEDPEFQRWYSLVSDLGKPLGITEYGRGQTDGTQQAGTEQARIACIQADTEYLRSLPNFTACWIYWWAPVGAGGQTGGKEWDFTDQASIDAWNNLAAIGYTP